MRGEYLPKRRDIDIERLARIERLVRKAGALITLWCMVCFLVVVVSCTYGVTRHVFTGTTPRVIDHHPPPNG